MWLMHIQSKSGPSRLFRIENFSPRQENVDSSTGYVEGMRYDLATNGSSAG